MYGWVECRCVTAFAEYVCELPTRRPRTRGACATAWRARYFTQSYLGHAAIVLFNAQTRDKCTGLRREQTPVLLHYLDMESVCFQSQRNEVKWQPVATVDHSTGCQGFGVDTLRTLCITISATRIQRQMFQLTWWTGIHTYTSRIVSASLRASVAGDPT